MLACKNPSKAISALLKLVSGEKNLNQAEITHLIQLLDREDDTLDGQLSEILSSHPMIIKRINQIREYATSVEFSNHLTALR